MSLPTLAHLFADEIRYEAATTRRYLEAVPDTGWDYRPNPKSMPLGYLASHLADLLAWAEDVLTTPELRFKISEFKSWEAKEKSELVPRLDELAERVTTLLATTTDESLTQTWNLYADDQLVLSMPRHQAIRYMVLNHLVHHRAQLGVYLRLRGIPVPKTYGPSADER